MRGLTDEERFVLTCPPGSWPTTLRHVLELRKRGLIATEHMGDHAEYVVLPAADLALRLDSAARAMGGVRG